MNREITETIPKNLFIRLHLYYMSTAENCQVDRTNFPNDFLAGKFFAEIEARKTKNAQE